MQKESKLLRNTQVAWNEHWADTLFLAYHNIEDIMNTGTDQYTVTKKNFYDHLTLLNRYCTLVNPASMNRIYTGSKPLVCITFDDGKKNNITHALPLLEKFGSSAIFFVTPDFMDTKDSMTKNDIRILAQSGMCIGSHSLTHPDFGTISRDQAHHELQVSKEILDGITGAPTTLFSYPFGNKWNIRDHDIAILIECGYSAAFVLGIHNNTSHINPSRIPRFLVADIRGNTLIRHVDELTKHHEHSW